MTAQKACANYQTNLQLSTETGKKPKLFFWVWQPKPQMPVLAMLTRNVARRPAETTLRTVDDPTLHRMLNAKFFQNV
jgi:hypothetical protein